MDNKIIILTRTSGRPVQFNRLKESIENQTFKNYKWIICSDNNDKYILNIKQSSSYFINKINPEGKEKNMYGKNQKDVCTYNMYLNFLLERVEINENNWILMIDDDDYLFSNKILSYISRILTEQNTIYHFQSRLEKKVMPDFKINLNKVYPYLRNLPLCSYIFNSIHVKHAMYAEPFQSGDYSIYYNLQKHVSNKEKIDLIISECPKVNKGVKEN